LDVLLVVGNELASLEVSVVSELVAEVLDVAHTGATHFDGGCVEHGDVRKGDVFVEEGQFFQLPLLVEVEHDLGLDFGEQIHVLFEACVHVIVFLGRLVIVINMVFGELLCSLLSVDVVLVVVEGIVLFLHLVVTPLRH